MTTARATQVDAAVTPYYHCISRCVRRAYLCGDDPYTGQNFDHRKAWVVRRLRFLATVFCVDVCAYAVMSNHLHLVLRLMAERARQLSSEQVVDRYCQVFPRSKERLEALPETEREAVIEVWRERLGSLSWMMRALNEWVARKANEEDGCSGRFWEGRFKSKALLDTRGLLTCMAYVDLNPKRAGIANGLEDSDFTSIQARLQARAAELAETGLGRSCSPKTPTGLAPMADDEGSPRDERLPIEFEAYLDLLAWTVGAPRPTPTSGPGQAPELLKRLGLCPDGWVSTMRQHQLATCTALGQLDALDAEAKRRGKAWLHGKSANRRLAL